MTWPKVVGPKTWWPMSASTVVLGFGDRSGPTRS